MQTQTVTKSKTDSVDAQISAAETNLSRLREIATDAEAEQQKWRTTFEREPTGQAHSELVVAEQRAKNARTAAEAHERDVLAPLLAQRKKAERDRIAAALDREADAVRDDFRRAAAMMVEAARLLDASVARLAAQHEPRLAAKQKGALPADLSLAAIVAEMNQQLAELSGGSYDVERAHIGFVDAGNTGRISVQINRAATVPATVR